MKQKHLDLAQKYLGRMNDPTASAYIKGICGDEMEFYLLIESNRLVDVKYFTNGCEYTQLCAAAVADFVQGKTIKEALSVSAGGIIEKLTEIPDDHLHCSILAVTVLYRAVADYLLRL
jgi:nitrogen fixation protein NifU and related proteins